MAEYKLAPPKWRFKSAPDIYINLLKLGFDDKTIQDFLNNINDADVVEVVRCSECKNRDKSGLCQAEGQKLTVVKDNHFCSKGERRLG